MDGRKKTLNWWSEDSWGFWGFKQNALEILFFKNEKLLLGDVWFWTDKNDLAVRFSHLWHLWQYLWSGAQDPGTDPCEYFYKPNSLVKILACKPHQTRAKLILWFPGEGYPFFPILKPGSAEVGALGNLLVPCDAWDWSQYDSRQSKKMERNQVLIIFSGPWIQSCHFRRANIFCFLSNCISLYFLSIVTKSPTKAVLKENKVNKEENMLIFNKQLFLQIYET